MGAMQRSVEIAVSRHDVQELLLDFCWAQGSDLGCASLSLWSIHKIVVRIGDVSLVLELCEEKVLAPSGITNALYGRSAIVTTELQLPLFPDFGSSGLLASPGFAVEDATRAALSLTCQATPMW